MANGQPPPQPVVIYATPPEKEKRGIGVGTILIIGGVAVGGFLIYQLIKSLTGEEGGGGEVTGCFPADPTRDEDGDGGEQG